MSAAGGESSGSGLVAQVLSPGIGGGQAPERLAFPEAPPRRGPEGRHGNRGTSEIQGSSRMKTFHFSDCHIWPGQVLRTSAAQSSGLSSGELRGSASRGPARSARDGFPVPVGKNSQRSDASPRGGALPRLSKMPLRPPDVGPENLFPALPWAFRQRIDFPPACAVDSCERELHGREASG